jgi:hypothetical protein
MIKQYLLNTSENGTIFILQFFFGNKQGPDAPPDGAPSRVHAQVA